MSDKIDATRKSSAGFFVPLNGYILISDFVRGCARKVSGVCSSLFFPEKNTELKQEAHSLVRNIDAKDLKKTVSKGITLLDIYAEWCGPCKRLAPLLEKVADEVKGKAQVVKLDGDQFRANKVIGDLKFEFYPTLIVFKDGKEIRRISESERNEQTIAKILSEASVD